MSIYDQKPQRFLKRLHRKIENPHTRLYCAGFELGEWRCKQFAFHLAEWLPDYALPEEELRFDHGNVLVKLNQAAVRVYTSTKYASRGEAGEIALHAICRDFFKTIPLSPRVFYKSASNDVVKAFDMVHARFPSDGSVQIWLGESKLFKSGASAIADAIKSIKLHIDEGFLSNQKLLLGPQIPKSTPRYDEIMQLFSRQESLDTLIKNAVFVVGILCDSKAVSAAKEHGQSYFEAAIGELEAIETKLSASGLPTKLKLVLAYIPLASKKEFVSSFDNRLKGLQ
ncbi:DUF1837 domain-containing protein [Sphingobium sp. EM0848]|uniref:HamA C-terminal domain-containing protein n=1 Tax=Sphingobium sp. EM0848 TaxID=2743473 RepID=UPI00159C1BDE|nr:DUF1837 domain-containing protein [Sphingobium sp. EM0848]